MLEDTADRVGMNIQSQFTTVRHMGGGAETAILCEWEWVHHVQMCMIHSLIGVRVCTTLNVAPLNWWTVNKS